MSRVHCSACDRDSSLTYRCEHCGHDLSGKQQVGREVSK